MPILVAAILALWSSLATGYEAALPRYALLIGNSDYQTYPLKNPRNDAKDMAEKLESIGYEVTVATDLSVANFRDTVSAFYRTIEGEGAVSLFYYAGHAVQLDNVNYLLPIDGGFDSRQNIEEQGYSMNSLLRVLKRSDSEQNIVILDACRNNPFRKESSSLPDGLAPVEAPAGTLVAYATEPGSTAADGKGRNGIYTGALLDHIERADTAAALFRKVRKDVMKATRGRQTPWEHSSLIETFYFAPPKTKTIPDIVGF